MARPPKAFGTGLGPHTEYEFYKLTLPRGTSRGAAHRMLTEQAEYGRWELARLRLLPDGTRKAVLRRKIIRQRRSAPFLTRV